MSPDTLFDVLSVLVFIFIVLGVVAYYGGKDVD